MATPKKKTTPATASKPSRSTEKASTKGTTDNASGERATTQEKTTPRPAIDPELVQEIKAQLLRKKNELGANVNNELDDMREAAEGHHLADMDDLGGDAHDEETQYKIMEIESAELGQIDQALERITNGTFGICEVCEKAITPDRLRALPFANLCIACKRDQEGNED